MSTPTDTNSTTMTLEDLDARLIRFTHWVPCKAAFIDCRTPGSDRKDNYSFVGPGVSQSSDQFVNLATPHGYQLGAAGMPADVSNNLHLHFTAEVFLNLGGRFRLRWGPDGDQGDYVSEDGDVISVPTWIFRGFTNIGPDDGILYTVLGRDDTGGIIWGPKVLQDAEGYGLYLTRDNRLVDTTVGDTAPAEGDRITPLDQAHLDELDVFTPEEFRTRVVTRADRRYSDRPFLCSVLPGGGGRLATVIGYGLSEDRRQVPSLTEPHSFCAAWLSATTGEGMLRHRVGVAETVTVKSGTWEVVLNDGDDEIRVTLGERDTLSVPAGVWRSFRCTGLPDGAGDSAAADEADLFVVTAGDQRVEIDWHPEVERAADQAGSALDPNHYVAPAAVLASIGLR
jgi:mannose-6-phosphate isomerase-like protein (cupin superfamily)